MNDIRIDKWLWAVRLFKTRSAAAEACSKGRIMLQGRTVKPSRLLKRGDVVEVKRPPIVYSFQVIELTDKRMGAKMVPQYLKDVTPPEQYEILELNRVSAFVDRPKHTGRPTKRERRKLDEFMSDISGNQLFDLGDDSD